ncbi:L,D-transpeptidase family protein [Propionivibrio limicola]|uniref:L,D-transpeptidase family protein n=1 Tax=Propionivibrio limicola TaxID=167645 RepID=UPI001FE24F9E|nr:L,D-transpeptidase family protein [Propionivibrio limicola]
MVAVFCCMALGAGASAADEPLWFDGGRPHQQAWLAVKTLQSAAQDGLKAENYHAELLGRTLAATNEGVVLPAETISRLDDALTEAMQRYLSDLHSGQIDPRQIEENFVVRPIDAFNPAAYLRAAVAEGRLPDAAARAAPALPLYDRLRRALAHYGALAVDPATEAAWLAPLPAIAGGKLEPRQPYAGLDLLTQRLSVVGDLADWNGKTPPRYEGALVDAVKSFQRRHGLTPDGVIGRATLEQLNVPLSVRVRQIELTMERLRWTPLLDAPRTVVVNVPELRLRAYEVRDGGLDIKVDMKVIVGKALNTRTPLFDEEMRFIEFSPYWNVPPSIARGETVPRLRREPGYFHQQGFEFVASDGRVSRRLSRESLDAVQRGQMRIRQRPGPMNALGDIKFVFPNKDNIYLHHTPTPRLFEKDRRDFSHGCIRVEEPVALAMFVLQNDPAWDEARIREVMAKGVSSTLRLREPVRVVIAYHTVLADEQGVVHFFPDIYGQDRRLDEALEQINRKDNRQGQATLLLKKQAI